MRLAADEQPPTDADVAEYMSRDIVTTVPETPVHEAASLMLEHDISHLPVVDDDSLVGIVTTTDVAKYASGIEDLLPRGVTRGATAATALP